MGRTVVDWLLADGWDVYQEVQIRSGSVGNHVADIVARRCGVTHVFECKTRMGMAVLAQAERWLRHANLVSVAVPATHHRERDFIDRVCRWIGIGWYSVLDGAHCLVEPRLRRRTTGQLEACLREEQRTALWGAAGNAGSERWTPFRATCQYVRQLLAKSGPDGMAARDVARAIKHHYASDPTATRAILAWAKLGKIPGVRTRHDGRRFTLLLSSSS